jgi:hypothetical protein
VEKTSVPSAVSASTTRTLDRFASTPSSPYSSASDPASRILANNSFGKRFHLFQLRTKLQEKEIYASRPQILRFFPQPAPPYRLTPSEAPDLIPNSLRAKHAVRVGSPRAIADSWQIQRPFNRRLDCSCAPAIRYQRIQRVIVVFL